MRKPKRIVTINVPISKDFHQRLSKLNEADGMPIAGMVESAVRLYLNDRENRSPMAAAD